MCGVISENQILRDNGIFGSAELRVPLIYGKERNPILVVAPFFDIGSGWNSLDDASARDDRDWEILPSIGVGLIFDPNKYVHAQIYWGCALNRDLVTDGDNLQDYGFHFVMSVNAF